MQNEKDFLVSVCVITYNHERYIRECLDSILSQKVKFNFNVFVSDDCSSDKTLEVLREYEKKHLNISVVSRCGLDKSYADGKPTGNRNFIENLKRATGRYIAVCDGDDVWGDVNKLQKQVDVLSCSDDIAIVCSQKNEIKNDVLIYKKSKFPNFKFSYRWLCFYNPIPTSSVMFKKECYKEPPEWFMNKLDIGDWPFWFLISYGKKIYKFSESFLNYRVHSSGAWSGKLQSDKALSSLKVISYLRSVHNHPLFLISYTLHYCRFIFARTIERVIACLRKK